MIEGWLNGLSEEARLSFHALIKNNHKIKNHLEWMGFRKFLKGKTQAERIWELEFKTSENLAYRVFGNFGPSRKESTLLMGCYHKGKVYTPPDAIEESIKRSQALLEGSANRELRKIRTDI
ncbi:MAG: hypothetical protein ACRD5G_01400 [Candidatus Acidiferrales bacterium]